MFSLPSIWNLIISTIVFFVAAWYVNRCLDAHEMPNGMTRSVLVFLIALLFSWGSGKAVDWAQQRIEGPQTTVQGQGLMKAPERARP